MSLSNVKLAITGKHFQQTFLVQVPSSFDDILSYNYALMKITSFLNQEPKSVGDYFPRSNSIIESSKDHTDRFIVEYFGTTYKTNGKDTHLPYDIENPLPCNMKVDWMDRSPKNTRLKAFITCENIGVLFGIVGISIEAYGNNKYHYQIDSTTSIHHSIGRLVLAVLPLQLQLANAIDDCLHN